MRLSFYFALPGALFSSVTSACTAIPAIARTLIPAIAKTIVFSLVGMASWGEAANWQVVPSACKDVVVSVDGESLAIQTRPGDPYLVGELKGFRSSDRVFECEYFSTSGVKKVELFLGPPMNRDHRMVAPPMPISETWRTYTVPLQGGAADALRSDPSRLRIDLSHSEPFDLLIRNVRLRPPNPSERMKEGQRRAIKKAKRATSDRIQRYLKASFPIRIDTVAVNESSIAIMGKVPKESGSIERFQLIECPIWNSVGDQPVPGGYGGKEVDAEFQIKGDHWRAVLPRNFEGRDRLNSSWRLADQDGFVSSRRFATMVVPGKGAESVTMRRPANQKGMGGVARNAPLEELVELGVTAITVNIPLSGFLSRTPIDGSAPIVIPGTQRSSRPNPGASESVTSQAPSTQNTSTQNTSTQDAASQDPVYFNPRTFRNFDPVMKWAKENEVVVSAILLVPVPQAKSLAAGKNPPAAAWLAHPANDGGKYSMPDLTTARGATVYAEILKRLARRYGDPRKPTGSVANWIAHNEVDFHQSWTNMGAQLPAVVTETYYRSMRMIHNAAREVHPGARVFASLTHHWSRAKNDHWEQLASKDFLQDLQRYSILEGDFSWGVAYHPYPASLFAATAWNDPAKHVNSSFDTPMITIQNIEVLPRFLNQPSMKDSARRMRPILLSEQGFHTADNSEIAHRNQAGSLVYAMRRIRHLPAIESFHYHRWVDHPREGGLLMGLRTLPTQTHPFGQKKLSWQVYQAIGTDREASVTKGLPGEGK